MRWSKTIKLIVINISRYISVYFYKLAIVKFTQYSFWHFVRKIKYLNTLKFHQNMNKNEYTSLKYISIKLHFNNFYYINITLRFTHHLRLKATIFNQIYISIKLYIFTDRRIKKQTNPFRIYLYIFYFLHTDKQKITWKNFPQVETKPKKTKNSFNLNTFTELVPQILEQQLGVQATNDAQALFRRFVSMNHGFKLKAGETCVTNDARLLNYAVKSGYARVSRKNRTVGQRLGSGEEEGEEEKTEATPLENTLVSLPPMSDNSGAI